MNPVLSHVTLMEAPISLSIIKEHRRRSVGNSFQLSRQSQLNAVDLCHSDEIPIVGKDQMSLMECTIGTLYRL